MVLTGFFFFKCTDDMAYGKGHFFITVDKSFLRIHSKCFIRRESGAPHKKFGINRPISVRT